MKGMGVGNEMEEYWAFKYVMLCWILTLILMPSLEQRATSHMNFLQVSS